METLIIIGLIAFFAVVGILRRVIVRKGDTTENLSDRYK